MSRSLFTYPATKIYSFHDSQFQPTSVTTDESFGEHVAIDILISLGNSLQVEEGQRRHRFFMTSQVRFVAALDSKKFVSFCIYSFGFYQLDKPVFLKFMSNA